MWGPTRIAGVWIAALAAGSAGAGEMRTWTDDSGTFKVEAELVDVQAGRVTLRKADGKTIEVRLDRLSATDRAAVEKSRNPFAETRPQPPPPPLPPGSAPTKPESSPGSPPPAPVDSPSGRGRLESVKRLYEQRLVLLSQWQDAKGRVQAINNQIVQANGDYVRVDVQARNVRATMAANAAEAAGLQQGLNTATDPVAVRQVNDRLDLLSRQNQRLSLLLGNLQAEGARLVAIVNGLRGQLTVEQAEIDRLFREADRLRDEWLSLCDPWGKLARGEQEQAIAVFSEWIALDASNPCSYLARGFAYLNTGKYDLATNDFERAMAIDSAVSSLALCGRGRAVALAGDARRAMADFNRCLKDSKGFALAHYFRGLTEMESGQHVTAERDLQTAAHLTPDSAEVLERYAMLLAASSTSSVRKGKKAVEVAERACRLTQNQDWRMLRTLAAAYAETGDFDSASTKLRQAMTLAPTSDRPTLEEHAKLYQQGKPLRF